MALIRIPQGAYRNSTSIEPCFSGQHLGSRATSCELTQVDGKVLPSLKLSSPGNKCTRPVGTPHKQASVGWADNTTESKEPESKLNIMYRFCSAQKIIVRSR